MKIAFISKIFHVAYAHVNDISYKTHDINPTYGKSELYFDWKKDGDKSPIEYSDGLDRVSNFVAGCAPVVAFSLADSVM